MRLGLAAVAALLVAAAPAAAKPVTETASLGSIRAELSYVTHKAKSPTAITLAVFDGDQQIVDETIPDDQFYSPAYVYVDKKSVRVVDLDGDGVGEAVFDLYTGGAHCCLDTYVYAPTHPATKIDLYTGNVGYRLKDFDGDGIPEILSADDGFSNAYSSYAGSLQPLHVLRLRNGEFENVTTDASVAPALRKEIKHYKKLLKRGRRKAAKDPIYSELVRSASAGITADYCSLGDCAKGYAIIDQLVASGEVTPGFRRQVHKDLKHLGYDV